MEGHKEKIWHFTCQSCKDPWSIASSDKGIPTEMFCPHCGKKHTHNKELMEWVIMTREWRVSVKEDWADSPELCSCGHNPIECDCKAGCKCGCRKQYLGQY